MASDQGASKKRRPTSTSSFGVSRRESHDASAFYSRFAVPEISSDQTVGRTPLERLDQIYAGDARAMTELVDSSVALVVTSPPYFAGKEYEEALGEGHIPATYVDYLEMLYEVFAECARVLEPGGRIAVNVANLGRKPYRSLAADVTYILQDRLGLLLRGEIIWQKGQGAAGSCAWGSFQSAANPVLRDLTERIIVASKGRFDRALSRRERQKKGLPSEVSIFKDDFMEATLDLWDMPPESATRVNHPAPFPVDLPRRLIELYTYRDDVVLDPFAGSGSTAVAALWTGRHYVGYDIDQNYVRTARKRVSSERSRLNRLRQQRLIPEVRIPAVPPLKPVEHADHQARAVREGQRAKEIAMAVLLDAKFGEITPDVRFGSGVEVNFSAKDARGRTWYFDVSGAFTSSRAGLRRTDTLWKALGKAAILKSASLRSQGVSNFRLLLLTTDLPPRNAAGDLALRAGRGDIFHDALRMLARDDLERLALYASGEGYDEPIGELLNDREIDGL